MIHIVWELIVEPETVERFAAAYGPGGDWARLFEQHPGRSHQLGSARSSAEFFQGPL